MLLHPDPAAFACSDIREHREPPIPLLRSLLEFSLEAGQEVVPGNYRWAWSLFPPRYSGPTCNSGTSTFNKKLLTTLWRLFPT